MYLSKIHKNKPGIMMLVVINYNSAITSVEGTLNSKYNAQNIIWFVLFPFLQQEGNER